MLKALRSIDQVSMFEILNAHQDLITKFGGHHMAAGMTMDIENIDELRKGLNEWMKQLSESTSLAPRKHVDVLLNESEITVKIFKIYKNCVHLVQTLIVLHLKLMI